MIEDVSTNKLKCNHTHPDTPLHVLLKEPHTWITNDEPTLPSNVILYVS